MPTLAEVRAIEYPEIQDLGEFDPETEETPDDAGAADDGGDTGEDTPADAVDPDGTPAPATDEPTEEKPEEAPAEPGVDKAKAFDDLNELYAKDRVGFIKQLLSGLSAEEQAALSSAPQAPTPPDWEPESPGEKWLAEHAQTIASLPDFANGVQQSFDIRDRYINEALVSNAALQEQVNALSEILGVTLPALDVEAVQKTLKGGKIGYRDAIKQHYGEALKKTVATKKQAAKPRPRTPGDAGNDIPQIKPGMSMMEIFNLQK